MRPNPPSNGQHPPKDRGKPAHIREAADAAPHEGATWGQTLKLWLALAFEAHTVRRALAYAVVIGALLIAINHFELLTGDAALSLKRAVQIVLTILVPYLVSTSSSVGAQLACGLRRDAHASHSG